MNRKFIFRPLHLAFTTNQTVLCKALKSHKRLWIHSTHHLSYLVSKISPSVNILWQGFHAHIVDSFYGTVHLLFATKGYLILLISFGSQSCQRLSLFSIIANSAAMCIKSTLGELYTYSYPCSSIGSTTLLLAPDIGFLRDDQQPERPSKKDSSP